MMNQNNTNHKGHSIMKVSAALAAMLLVSGMSIGMYKLVSDNKTAPAESSVSESIPEAESNTETEEQNQSTPAVQATNMSWVEMASAADALTIPEIVEKAMPSAVGISATFTYSAQTSAAGYRSFGFGGMFENAQPSEEEVNAAGSGIVMRQPEFISARVRTEATRPEFAGGDRFSALRAYRASAFRNLSANGIPVAIGFDCGFRETNGTSNCGILHT